MAEFNLPKYGHTKAVIVNDTTQYAGNIRWIFVDEAAVFSELTGTVTVAAGSAIGNTTHPAGKLLGGVITSFTLASGAVTAYLAEVA